MLETSEDPRGRAWFRVGGINVQFRGTEGFIVSEANVEDRRCARVEGVIELLAFRAEVFANRFNPPGPAFSMVLLRLCTVLKLFHATPRSLAISFPTPSSVLTST